MNQVTTGTDAAAIQPAKIVKSPMLPPPPSVDIWAPDRAAGPAAGSSSLPPLMMKGGRRSAIPGMSLRTVSGASVDPEEAPEAMEFEALTPLEEPASDDGPHAATTSAARTGTKLERRKQKREEFLKKLNTLHSNKRRHQEIARKKANPPVVVGDVTGLFEQLDEIAAGSVADAAASKKEPIPAGMTRKTASAVKARMAEKVKRTTSKKGRKAALATESVAFKATLSHPQFRMKPAETIAEHLRNSIRAEKAALAAAGGTPAETTEPKAAAKGAPGGRTSIFKEKARLHGKLGKGGRLSKHTRRDKKKSS